MFCYQYCSRDIHILNACQSTSSLFARHITSINVTTRVKASSEIHYLMGGLVKCLQFNACQSAPSLFARHINSINVTTRVKASSEIHYLMGGLVKLKVSSEIHYLMGGLVKCLQFLLRPIKDSDCIAYKRQGK